MMRSLYGRILYHRRWFTVGWALAIGLMVAFVVAFFPSFSGGDAYQELFANMPEQMKGFIGDPDSFTKLPNYIATQLYDIRIPLFMMIMSLVLAQALTVAQEERGLLRGLLATPMSRGRILLETWAAGITIIGVIAVISALATYLGIFFIQETYPHALIWRLTLLSFLSGIAAFTIPFAVGFIGGMRAITLSIGLVLVVGSFVISSFAMGVEWLRNIEPVSLLYYYDTAALLTHGFNQRDLWVLSGVSATALACGWVLFRWRDTRG